MPVTDNGIAHLTSSGSVSDVLEHLLSVLRANGIAVFAVIDHSGGAASAGMEMRDTKLVIFGNPLAGTPVMIAAPDSALDLPLKILIAEEPGGATRISYNSPAYLQGRHGLKPEEAKSLARVEQLAAAIAV